MSETERVVNDLNIAKLILCNPQMLTPEMCIRIGQAITSTIALLKEQEEQIKNSDESLEKAREEIKWLRGMLKEEVPVEPTPPTDESDLWRCGNCNHQLFRCTHQRYCPMCGRSVKWE